MAQAGTQTPGTPSSVSLAKSPKRKNTGLAGALAASGLAMANSAFAMPQIAPAEIMGRPDRSESVTSNGATSHRARSSVDNTRSPTRARQTSISYATSEYSDHDSFVSGVEGASDEDDDLDLDADDIPVTGFAVASARRNQEFHEMFPNIPEGDYLIEGACPSLRRKVILVSLCVNGVIIQTTDVRCNARSSFKAGCTYPRTTFVSTPTYSVG